MRMTKTFDIIFSHNDRYWSIQVTTAGLNRLLLAAGEGNPNVNLPPRAPYKFKSFSLSFMTHWLRIIYFSLEDTHGSIMLTNFEKKVSKNKLFFIRKSKFWFLNKVEKITVFLTLCTQSYKYHEIY